MMVNAQSHYSACSPARTGFKDSLDFEPESGASPIVARKAATRAHRQELQWRGGRIEAELETPAHESFL